MRKIVITVCCLIALAFAWHDVSSDAGDKKPPEKMSADEIEKLVVDLGSKVFAIRDNAFRRLAEMPYALPTLRRFRNDKDIDRRLRIEALLKDLTQKQFKKTLARIVKQGQDAPLDLLVDVVAEHRDRMDAGDWKSVNETIRAVANRALTDNKAKLKIGPERFRDIPDPMKFLEYPLVRAESLAPADAPGDRRVVGDRTAASCTSRRRIPFMMPSSPSRSATALRK